MKKFAIIVFISIFLILGTVTLLFCYIRTDHAVHLLTNRVNQSIPGRIQARSWDISLFPLSIGLSGIEVEGPDQKQCVAVESVEAILDLSSLFNGTIELRSLAIQKPQIDLARDEQGSVNIVNAFVSPESQKDQGAKKPDSKSPLPMNILVRKAVVDQGTLVFKDPAGGIRLSGIRIRLSRFNLGKKSFSLSFETGSGSGTLREENITFSKAKVTAAFDPKTGADLKAAVQSDLFTLRTTGKIFSFTRNPEVEIDLHAESRLGVISRFTDSYTGPKGDVILSLTGSGALNNPDVEFEVKMPELSGPGAAEAKAVDVNASLSEKVLTIEKANLDLLGTTVRAKGSVDLSHTFPKGFLEPGFDLNKTEYDLSFSQKGMDLKLLKPWIKGLSGRLSARGSVSGKGIHTDVLDGEYHLQLTAENFKPPGPGKQISHAKIAADGRIKDHILTVKELTARTPDAETLISGQVNIRKQQCRGTLTARTRDLLSTLSVAGIHMFDGAIEGRVDFSGDLFNPSIDARINADNLSVDGILIDSLELDGSLLPSGKALIGKLEVTKDRSSVLLTGEANIFKNDFLVNESMDADFTITGKNLIPGSILDWANLEMETRFLPSRVDFELAGRLLVDLSDFPDKSGAVNKMIPVRAVHADLDIKEKSLFATFDKSTDLTAVADTKENRYRASLQFRKTPVGPFLQTAGIAGLTGSVTGSVKASGEIPATVPPDTAETLESAGGTLTLDADLAGTVDRPDFNAALTIREGSSVVPGTAMQLSQVAGTVKVTREKMIIKELKGKLDQGSFAVAGTIDLENLVPKKVDLTLEGERILVKIEDVDFELGGRLLVDLSDFPDKSGAVNKMIPVRAIHADLDIEEKSLFATFDKSTDLTAVADTKENRYRASLQFRKTPVGPFLQAAGIAGLKGSVTGSVKASGEIPATVPPDAAQTLEDAGGTLTLDANLAGTVDRPDFNAALTIREGSSVVPGTAMQLSQVAGTVKATSEKMIIKEFKGKLDQGSFAVAGTIDLENLVPKKVDLTLEGERILVKIEDTAMVLLDTDLAYSLTPDNSLVSGRVEILEGEYTKDFNVNPVDMIKQKTRASSPASSQKSSKTDSILTDTQLDVRINARSPFVVDNNVILASIDPDLSITGRLLRPIPLGRITITEGTVTYFKREFEIEKGNIRLSDPYAIEPEIELTATHRVRDWTIRLAVSGKSDNLDFRLTSDPKESHQDIVSLLVTGKTAKELSSGSGKSSSPASIVIDKASGMINKSITESTPLDSFEMDYEGGGENGANVDVTMGKELSRRLSVKYRTGTENQQTIHTGEAEYKLLENLMFKTFNDSAGNFGGEMKFKLEFR